MRGLINVSCIVILVWILMAGNASAIGDPYIVYGYVKYDDGSPVNGASVIISVPDQALTETTNSEGKYIGALDKYTDGDILTVTASLDTHAGSTENILDKASGGSLINVIVHDGDTIPPPPITDLTSTTGNFWINWTWTNPEDCDFGYAVVYIDNAWQANVSNNYYKDSYPPHSVKTISIKTVDVLGNVNNAWVNQTAAIPNNPMSLTNISSSIMISEGQTVYIDADALDGDSDTPVFSCNRTDLFSDFNPVNGQGSFNPTYARSGTYHIGFGVSDGYGSISNKTLVLTVSNVPLSIISTWNNVTDDDSASIEIFSGNSIEFGIETNRIPTSVNWSVNGSLEQNGTSLNWSGYWDAVGTYYVNVSAIDGYDTTPDTTWVVTVISPSNDTGIIFSDDIKSGTNGWSASGLWHISSKRSDSPTHCWWYGQESTGDYDTGAKNSGYLTSPSINLAGVSNPVLSFKSWYQTEDTDKKRDLMIIRISADGGRTWITAKQISDTPSTWNLEIVDLSSYADKNITIRFYFNTVNQNNNHHEGWYIDDIKIAGNYS